MVLLRKYLLHQPVFWDKLARAAVRAHVYREILLPGEVELALIAVILYLHVGQCLPPLEICISYILLPLAMAWRTEHFAAIGDHQGFGELETAPIARAHRLRNLLFPVENAFEKITEPHFGSDVIELIYKFFIIEGYSEVIFLNEGETA